jgi:two-component system, OmpR family, copper resistance phosphate regulon response regulator CusR
MRLLVVEDEEKTALFLKKGLTENGFVTEVAHTGEEGLRLARSKEYDLIILDVMLPGQSGWQVMRNLRSGGIETPVIYLTARDAVSDRVAGLELGADDYLVKPFEFSELLARIQTVLRRGPSRLADVVRVADLEIDFTSHRVTRGGQRINLTPKEFALLSLLARKTGQVMTRTRIAERVWDVELEADTNVVDVHVRRLRAKVDDPYEKKLIHTVRGLGYVLEDR